MEGFNKWVYVDKNQSVNISRKEEIMKQNSIEPTQDTLQEQSQINEPVPVQESASEPNESVQIAPQEDTALNEPESIQTPPTPQVQPDIQKKSPPNAKNIVQQQPQTKSKKKHIIIIVIAVIALCIIGAVILGVISSNSSGSKKRKDRDKSETSSVNEKDDKLDLTDYDSIIEDTSEESIVYDGPEESIFTQLSISNDENGDFQMLYGSFDEKIFSKDDAFQFISDHSDEIGISNPSSELNFLEEQTNEGIKYYRFNQIYHNIPVYGNQLIVTVKTNGTIDSVSGTYTSIDIGTSASKSLEEAETAAKTYIGGEAEIISSDLTVLPHTESGSPKLVYDINVISDSKSAELFIDANSCEIISENKLYSAAMEAVDVKSYNSVHHVELDKITPDIYFVHDTVRDIVVSDAGFTSYSAATLTKGILGGTTPIAALKLSENLDKSINLNAISIKYDLDLLPIEYEQIIGAGPILTEYAVGSLSGIQKAYDYYNSNHKWKSFDGKGMPIKIIVGVNEVLGYEEPDEDDTTGEEILKLLKAVLPNLYDVENAFYVKDTNIVMLGAINARPLTGNGIIGHEYTHGVINNIAHLESNVQASTIDEGYADVMGSIITGDWEFSVNEIPSDWKYYQYAVRSAIDPNKYGAPAKKDTSDPNYKPAATDEHVNATIVSHSAYLMTQKGLSNEKVADVFFGSIFNLSPNPDFEEAALAILKTADNLSYSTEEKQAIYDSFVETKMLEPKTKTIYVHCGNRYIPDATVIVNGTELGKTDEDGFFVFDWLGDAEISVKADGFDGMTQNIFLFSDVENLDFNLAVNKEFGEAHGSDSDKTGTITGEKVTVTILAMSADSINDKVKETAQDYYVQKGAKISLQKLVDALGMDGVTTDGVKIYIDSGYFPIELSYYIYGTDELFYFNKPIYEDVVIEPRIGFEGIDFGNQDFLDFADQIYGNLDLDLD